MERLDCSPGDEVAFVTVFGLPYFLVERFSTEIECLEVFSGDARSSGRSENDCKLLLPAGESLDPESNLSALE